MFTNLGIQDKRIVVFQKATSSGRGKFTLRNRATLYIRQTNT